MECAVDVAGLRVQRGGHEILHAIDLQIQAGKVTGLLGPSGCGKTTLMRCVVGVQRGVAGRVQVLDRPAGSAALRGRVGYVPQSAGVYTDLSVAENLRFFAAVLGADRAQVDRVIDSVALAPFAGQVVASLSGGQRARVSLAVAMLGNPALLILDEPTVGLDPLLRTELWHTFHGLAAAGVTLLVSSHVMDEAAHCDALLLLREGRLVAQSTPADLLHQTRTDTVEAAFIALIARGDAAVRTGAA